MPCKPDFKSRVDGEGRRRYWRDGGELSRGDWIAAYYDYFGELPPDVNASLDELKRGER